jgi:arylsulfatase A-like enzyme
MIWRPAPSANVVPAEVTDAVGQVDLAPTFCEIAGVPAAAWMQGKPLPKAPGGGHERMITEWDSQFPGIGMHLRTIYRDGFTCTVYEPSTIGQPTGLEAAMPNMRTRPIDIVYNGSEGELYNHAEDPHQWRNLWDDPKYRKLRDDLVADLYDNLPPARDPKLLVEAPT